MTLSTSRDTSELTLVSRSPWLGEARQIRLAAAVREKPSTPCSPLVTGSLGGHPGAQGPSPELIS